MPTSTIDTSGIDITQPEEGSATTQSVRDNTSAIKNQLDAAKTDIDGLGTMADQNADSVDIGGGDISDTTTISDPSDNTKQVRIDAGSITTGTTRVLTMPDRDVTPADAGSANTFTGVQTFSDIADFSTAGAYFGTAAAANLLDDYEEGTWTPTYYGGTTAGTATYTTQQGRYTKVGNKATATLFLNIASHTGSGDALIGGFPFVAQSSDSTRAIGGVLMSGATYTGGHIVGMMGNGNSVLTLYEIISGSAASAYQIESGAVVIRITVAYEV